MNIGKRPTVNRPLATRAPTTAAPPPPPPPPPSAPQPSPPVYFVDQRGSGIGVSRVDDSSRDAAAVEIQILRQDQEETENGYHYV